MEGRAVWKPDLRDSGKPIYLAVADAITDDLRTGRLAPGVRLPAQRDLADALEVDLTTITRAYGEARRRGLITSTVGKGTFVAGPLAAGGATVSTDGVADMSMNRPPPIWDPDLTGRMWRSLSDLERDPGHALLFRYQDPAGARPDREAGVAWLRERLSDTQADRIVVSAGAQPAIAAIMALTARPGETVCADNLTYPGVRAAAAFLGVSLVGLTMDVEGIIPAGFEQACREVGPKALYCTPTLQNPTTATLSLARRWEIARIARRHGVAVIEDDPYGMLPAAPLAPIAALAPEITWHVAGLAKALSPALRIAYVVAPDGRAASRLAAGLRAITGMASPLTAALATAWIRDGVAGALLRAIREETLARRRMAADVLGEPFGRPEEAYHLWFPLPAGWSRAVFQDHLARRQIAVAPSDAFALSPQSPDAVRVGLGAAATRDDLLRTLEAIRDVLGGSPSWATNVV
jgi:DNA-binding transcriptional MocR family regulator